VSIDGMTPGELDNALFNEYKIHTVGIVWENISCVRITPHVYTRIQDLDKLVYALEKSKPRKNNHKKRVLLLQRLFLQSIQE
jgi:selenocysteine lyase/cysteine desulfurase